ncbi:glycosyltransferase family 1 protein [Acinetobacter pittii]|nr:glycosyltransferase [Acinetobacter pittii]RZG80187.1 glycosyltransferase family 1 protein [Acinetobacter pittii]RZH51869.1 glycosyltransferase family 1 protein [Acinetobacter pittii]RZH55690.1 glycosyltransferase family 1 protein [Acinetobacter pittii]
MKILINAANLHSGGGVQVASSFINELPFLSNSIIKSFDVIVSSEVDKNISQSTRKFFKNYNICNIFGLKNYKKNLGIFDNYDLVFTIFGPCYYNIKGLSVVGFAQAWIIYPDNECYKLLSFNEKFKLKIKYFLQKIFFKRSDFLIVELEHVKNRLVELEMFNKDNISVVYNTVSNVYFSPEKWEEVNIKTSDKFKIGLISRDYFHKNTSVLPQVKEVLRKKYQKDVDFYVTFNEEEWANKSSNFQENIINVGPLKVNECPNFYEKMDAIIFPSLLECFSATPLEAMIMEKPLFASDRGFIKDVCLDFAYYFEPTDPESAAAVINDFIENKNINELDIKLTAAQTHAKNFSSAHQRAVKYTQIIENCLNKEEDSYV